MNIVLKSFIEAQAEINPSVKNDFRVIFKDARIDTLNISKYADKEKMSVNLGYYDSEDHLEDCIKEPFFFLLNGRYKGKPESIWKALKQNPVALVAIHNESQTKAMLEYCLEKHPELIAYCNRDLIDKNMAQGVLNKQPMLFEFLPDIQKNYKNAMGAIHKDIRVVQYFPDDLIDKEVMGLLLNHDSFILDSIPFSAWDLDIITKQIGIDPNRSVKQCIKSAEQYFDQDLFNFLLNNIDCEEKNRHSISNLMSKGDFNSEKMIQLINNYLSARPQALILFDVNLLNSQNITHAISLGLTFPIPEHHWGAAYRQIYNMSSPLVFTAGLKQKNLMENNELKWCLLWASLYGDEEIAEKAYLSPIFLTPEIIENSDLWAKIFPTRMIYKLQQDFLLNDLDALKQITIENTHPYEIEKHKDNFDKQFKLELFEQDRFWYFVLDDDQKDEKNTLRFIKDYPELFEYLPKTVLTKEFAEKAKMQDPYLSEYL